jgi:predicted amino acid dehydrogenase
MAVQALRAAAKEMGIPLHNATAAVVGATGAIGRVCAESLAGEVGRLILIARDEAVLEELRNHLRPNTRAELVVSTKMHSLSEAQLILTVTSAVQDIIDPADLQAGSVICDVARPRDVSAMVARARNDILVIDGGMVDVPGPVNFHFDFGFPEGKAYACMAETMALALEGRFEDYTIGKDITLERVNEITAIAKKHGFRLSGFRSFEREVTEEQIEIVRRNARRTRVVELRSV